MSSEEEFTFKETEIGSFPDDWEVMQLGDAAELIMGQSPPGNTYNEISDGIPFLQGKAEFGSINPNHIKYTTKPLKIAPEGTVLISVRAPVGDVNIADINYCIGRGLAALCLRDGENLFLFYILNFLKPEIEKEGTGSTFKAINKSKLQEFKIPLPPLPEQHRIAAVLSAVQDAKEKSGTVIAAAKSLKKSLMRHLFTYGPVSIAAAESVPLTETEIGLVPEGWEVVRLGEVVGGTQYGLSMRGNQQGQYPILRMSNLIDGRVNTSDLQYVDLDEASFNKFRLNGGDILFNRTNSFELVGKTALFCVCDDFVFASYLIRVVPDTAMLVPEYLNYYLNWDTSQTRLKTLASRGVSQSNINATKLKGFSIPLPPRPLQQKIAGILSTVDKKIEAEENKKIAFDELFKSLLHNLMTGKIRVNNLEVRS